MLLTFLTSDAPLQQPVFGGDVECKLAEKARVKECRSAITKSCHNSKLTQRSFKKSLLIKIP